MKDGRKPWLKWYPADWRADPRLRMCGLAARGLWIELLGYMHESPHYGHLFIGDAVPTPDQIGQLVGAPPALVRRCLEELSAAGVFSVRDDGVIYSRRMLRDKQKAETDAANGKEGGNPQLRGSVKRGVNPPVKAHIPEARNISGADAPGGEVPPEQPIDPLKAFWKRGLAIVGDTAAGRSFFGKLRKTYGDIVVAAALGDCEAECPSEPLAYLSMCCERRKANGKQSAGAAGHARALDILAQAARDADESEGYRSASQATH